MCIFNVKHFCFLIGTVLLYSTTNIVEGHIDIDKKKGPQRVSNQAGCTAATSKINLDVNNVRAMVLNGGDMWWDLADAKYEVPKVVAGGIVRTSIFSGAVWIGGLDLSGNLKVAAQTYRQDGNDYYPGPLTTDGKAEISGNECKNWDKHFKIDASVISEYKEAYESGKVTDGSYTIPDVILDWPAHGNSTAGQAKFLAPYRNVEGGDDGVYDPFTGDYPKISGDQSIWWVMNDKGNNHTASPGSVPIGIELQIMAFAYVTNDATNDMTFYEQKLINRSTNILTKTYLGQWVDPDLGNYQDDYVGCDVKRGLGICYNGDDNDETTPANNGYGPTPPAVGVDFFKGPKADPLDGVDNDRDGTIDETSELIIMSNFLYYNNDANPKNGNPNAASDFYNYLRNLWRDGTACTYDLKDGTNQSFPKTNFMFPGDSDPEGKWTGSATPWDETTAGNEPGDRRFLQSAGPFTLFPGQVINLTIGVVWAKADNGGAMESVKKLKEADDLAQSLFEQGFSLTRGPDAPDLTVTELDQELIFTFSPKRFFIEINGKQAAFSTETYSEPVPGDFPAPQPTYDFQGYVIYQLKNSEVKATDINDLNLAKTLPEYQCDLKDNITNLINYKSDPVLKVTLPYIANNFVPNNNGIFRTIRITKDIFNSNAKIINNQPYYFIVLAYGACTLPGLKQQFIVSSKNIGDKNRGEGISYMCIPHKNPFALTKPKSNYGDLITYTQLSGTGNSGKRTELVDETINEILSKNYVTEKKFVSGFTPIQIKVSDPTKVIPGTFELQLINSIHFIDDTLKATVAFAKYGDLMIGKTSKATGKVLSLPDQKIDSALIKHGPVSSIFNGTGGVIGFVYTDTLKFINGEDAIIKRGDSLIRNFTFTSGVEKYNHWILKETSSDFVYNSTIPITRDYEEQIKNYGFSLFVKNTLNPGTDPQDSKIKDVIFDTLEFSNPQIDKSNEWLTGINERQHNIPWISVSDNLPLGKIILGAVVPFKIIKVDDRSFVNKGTLCRPSFTTNCAAMASWADLYGVDLVLTTDKSKWTRCIVVNSYSDVSSFVTLEKSKKLKLRYDYSKNKEGQVEYPIGIKNDTIKSMSWFPGYAINVDKGERVNIIFAEDISKSSGRDMLWNPSESQPTLQDTMGGGHFTYIMKTRYDECKRYYNILKDTNFTTVKAREKVFSEAMWVSIPLVAKGKKFMASDVRVKIRVTRSFGNSDSTYKSYPAFRFTTNDHSVLSQGGDFKANLDLIRVVPNPYYAYSSYENSAVDNRVRITNLPNTKTTISIFTINGTMIRRYERDENRKEANQTFLDWDLKNQYGIPVASGAYIIHIDADGIGEKIVKFFGIMRPVELGSGGQ